MIPDFVLSKADALALQSDRVVVSPDDAVFFLSGPGTIACLQGILTNDLVKCGPQALIWGAVLTAKGMIVTDLWVRREGDTAWLIVPKAAHERIATLLARSFPPRLTKVVDRTGEVGVRILLAPGAGDVANIAGAMLPHAIAPFTAMILCDGAEATAATDKALAEAGWRTVSQSFLDARKLLTEWPTLGREIDEKTLVQEVRFDELGGVKYDKGCYTGQETVARLHFRGHANRGLQRLTLAAVPTSAEILENEKVVGRLTTWGWLGDDLVALAVVRKAR